MSSKEKSRGNPKNFPDVHKIVVYGFRRGHQISVVGNSLEKAIYSKPRSSDGDDHTHAATVSVNRERFHFVLSKTEFSHMSFSHIPRTWQPYVNHWFRKALYLEEILLCLFSLMDKSTTHIRGQKTTLMSIVRGRFCQDIAIVLWHVAQSLWQPCCPLQLTVGTWFRLYSLAFSLRLAILLAIFMPWAVLLAAHDGE